MENTSPQDPLYHKTKAPSCSKKDKRKRDTKAITLRMDRWWLRKLQRIAYRLSAERNCPIGVQDLIREATGRVFIDEDLRNVIKREGLTPREKYKLFVQDMNDRMRAFRHQEAQKV